MHRIDRAKQNTVPRPGLDDAAGLERLLDRGHRQRAAYLSHAVKQLIVRLKAGSRSWRTGRIYRSARLVIEQR